MPRLRVADNQRFELPQFLQPLASQLSIVEGEPFALNTQVEPSADPSLRVEWTKDGKPIGYGSRIGSEFDRGFATLDIQYSQSDDVGLYSCVAMSNSGTTESNVCQLSIISDSGVVRDSEKELLLSDKLTPVGSGEHSLLHRDETQPPSFTMQLGPAQVTVRENQEVHLEARIAPASDPNLIVDWFKDGRLVGTSCRINIINDRGYLIFDIAYAQVEDTGDYCCLLRNKSGTVNSNIVRIECIGEAPINNSSQLPLDSVKYLDSIDAPGDVALKYEEFRYRERREPDMAPTFDVPPETVAVRENDPAKFIVKIDGSPKPRVLWFINGDIITSTPSHRIYRDGAINYLEFFRCSPVGTKQIRCVAKNRLGEIAAEAQLVVVALDDYRPELRHIMPENQFRKLLALRKIVKSEELKTKFDKPKLFVTEFRKVERESEIRARLNKPEVTEAENLYINVQGALKRSEHGVYTGADADDEHKRLKELYISGHHLVKEKI